MAEQYPIPAMPGFDEAIVPAPQNLNLSPVATPLQRQFSEFLAGPATKMALHLTEEQANEQLMAGMNKLEISLDDMKNITSNQETRIQLLEAHCSRIPSALGEDFAVMKSQLSMYRKISWMVISVVVGLVVKTFFDLMAV